MASLVGSWVVWGGYGFFSAPVDAECFFAFSIADDSDWRSEENNVRPKFAHGFVILSSFARRALSFCSSTHTIEQFKQWSTQLWAILDSSGVRVGAAGS